MGRGKILGIFPENAGIIARFSARFAMDIWSEVVCLVLLIWLSFAGRQMKRQCQ
jgi:hypothetical protein